MGLHRAASHWTTALALAACCAAPAARASAEAPLTADTRAFAQQVHGSGDAAGLPYAVIDKRAATMVVFHADGRVAGATPVLIGADPGDHSVPGVGERTQVGRLLPGDATTPAGRFVAHPGRNHTGEHVIWVDPDAAFAIHRLRTGVAEAGRAKRLASPRARDRRASAGCVVVPVAFYEQVVRPVLGTRRAVVYVMPEFGRWQALAADLQRRGL